MRVNARLSRHFYQTPSPHPARGQCLSNLANVVGIRFKQRGDPDDIDKAIALNREALALRPPSHPDHGISLNILADAVQTRFELRGNSKDIVEAINLSQEALALHLLPHPDRGMSLNTLANAVHMRFQQRGHSRDIDEAIDLHREALTLCLPPHPSRGSSLHDLANVVLTRFQQRGDSKDLDEAIEFHREALDLHPPPHPSRGISLSNLANAVQIRFEQRGDSKDIDEAIELNRASLALHPTPHLQRGMSLNNLANVVEIRFDQRRDPKDIDEAIHLHRAALELRASPHPDRGVSLNNLANAVRTRSEQQGDSKDMDEAIQLNREALALRLPPHPHHGMSLSNLATAVQMRFRQQGDSKDMDEAISLHRKALAMRAPPHADHSSSLYGLATAIELLPQLAAHHLDLSSRQDILSTAEGTILAAGAAAYAVSLGDNNTSVEFLEASRAVFWSQALQLQTPFDDLAISHPDLAAKLRDISTQLDQTSFRDTTRNALTDSQHKFNSIEAEGARCRKLNEEWEQIINSVRILPDFNDFMRPKGIDVLKQAAVSGPIVILTANDPTCFALIVTSTDEVQCLKIPELNLSRAELLANLSRALSNRAFDFDLFLEAPSKYRNHPQDQSELLDRLVGKREGRIDLSSEDVFPALLGYLWENIVKPKSAVPRRLWWCATGPFAFLPIHAAGIYKDAIDCTSDYVVSSYTPTLTALLDPPVHTTATFKFTAVIESHVPNYNPLPGALEELRKLVAAVPDEWLTSLVNTTSETALAHLRKSSIVHFACHGVQDFEQPLDSGLILSDGRLKVSEIMRRPGGDNALAARKSMSLAFLSACETAKGDKTTPDEAMHLARSLLFAGFRGVVATMWTMDDFDGPKIAATFYEHLFKDCDPNSNPPVLPDLTQAATALHLAVAKLRREKPDIPFRRWVPFVHYGL
ncbi:CHAT domain-containing protein [Mycena galericulata]|nr:CHAT domain-containing protein [Mycena galericulata]